MIIRKIKEKLKGVFEKLPFFRTLYYFVPQCPVCGSWRTGHYVREPRIDPEYMYRKALEHGESIRFAPSEPIENCYCEECGHIWGQHVSVVFLTADEMVRQKELRGTGAEYTRYKEINYVNGRPPKPGLFNRMFF